MGNAGYFIRHRKKPRQISAALLLFAIAFLAASCARTSEFQLDGASISIPSPHGFVPLGDQSPEFRTKEQRWTTWARILEIYLTKSDLDEVRAGHSKERRQSMRALAAPPIPNPSFDAEALAGAKMAVRDHGPMSDATMKDLSSLASRGDLNALKATQEKIWHPAPNRKWLGVYFESADAIGDSSVLTSSKDGQTVYATEVLVTMRVRDRLLLLSCKNLTRDGVDSRTPQEACRRWSEDIVRANS